MIHASHLIAFQNIDVQEKLLKQVNGNSLPKNINVLIALFPVFIDLKQEVTHKMEL